MQMTSTQMILSAILISVTLLTGILLGVKQKPYAIFLVTIHKILSGVTILFIIFIFMDYWGTVEFSIGSTSLLMLGAFFYLLCLVTGEFFITERIPYPTLRILHPSFVSLSFAFLVTGFLLLF
jgi:hypothetical protein